MKSYSDDAPDFPKAVLFDLLTALLDSWSVWNTAAGSEQSGRAWRAEYLRLTYGCGAYVPYETLVRRAAENIGLSIAAADRLESNWETLPVWSGANEALAELSGQTKLAVVTNCSKRLGFIAAQRLDVKWDCIVTAEEAGYYKPDDRPYRMALDNMEVEASEAVFVAGSAYDLFGTSKVGLRTYWHNRIGLHKPEGAPEADFESPTLDKLIPWIKGEA
jgi:2-haloacid dehalogenase